MTTFYCKASRFWLLLMVFMLIALGTIGMGATLAYATGTQVPFRGSYSGTLAFASDGTPLFSGTGISTHLGKGTNEGYVLILSGQASCIGGVPNDNYETLTAANGDSLTIVSHDEACPIPNMPGWFHGTGHWEVTGGTGRFSGATGQGTLDGHVHFIPGGEFSFQLTGTISAPAGK
ncbi:MAG: hypothetical protein HYX89_00820 [Chloroflexi bacterium]|nr:hypothetical protein [Chloroflexota bacterium]